MSEQIIDLRSTWAILRQHAGILVIAASLGALAGGAAAYLRPPVYSSTSIVLLPPAPTGSSSTANAPHSIDTHVEIAQSEAVLGPAGDAVTPRLGAAEVAERLKVEASTTDVLRITAAGATPAEARTLTDAVANAEIEYLNAAAHAVDEGAQEALSQRATTLRDSLTVVNGEIKKAQVRLSQSGPSAPAGQADAAALAELTAQQANLVLQLDKIEKEAVASSQPVEELAAGASVIQRASPAVRMPLVLSYALFVVGGAAAAASLAALLIVMRGRREQVVRFRDQIADAIGIPVVASIQSRAARSVAGWTSLLQSYSPPNVEMWTLRQLVRLVTPGHPGSLAEDPGDANDPPGVVVLTLSGDGRALAVGPQLASFAASTGIATQLVIAQTDESANALWAACSGLPADKQPRPGLSVDSRRRMRFQALRQYAVLPHVRQAVSADLVISIAVMHRQRPELHLRTVGQAVTLLAVSAGAATAEDLARVALAADDSGHPIARIVVVDPDPLDRTTGRLLPSERAAQVPLPSLMTGSAVTSEESALEARRRWQ